jgi:hypothetical protein
MADLTYVYNIKSLKVQNEPDYPQTVVQTYWTLTGTDANGNSGTFNGGTPFTYDPTDASGPFVPFPDLTEADVVGWISGVVNGNPTYKAHIDGVILDQIGLEINPVVEEPLPWAPTPPTPPVPPT